MTGRGRVDTDDGGDRGGGGDGVYGEDLVESDYNGRVEVRDSERDGPLEVVSVEGEEGVGGEGGGVC